MANREKATKELLRYIRKILPGSENEKIWKDRLEAMSDKKFEAFIKRLESDEEVISLTAPNLDKSRLSVDRNIKVAEELGHDFFQHLWLTDPHTGSVYKTPKKYLVVDLPLRRQIQMLREKTRIKEDHRKIDELTNQPAGTGGAKLSFPELQTLYAQGFDKTIEELIKFRGGDLKAYTAMNNELTRTGSASIEAIGGQGSKVKSTETLSSLLKGMHLDNNL